MYFEAHCAGVRGLSPGTIHNYLYGIRSWSINQGLPDPLRTISGQPLLRLARVSRGIKNVIVLLQTKDYLNTTSFERAARIILFSVRQKIA